MRYDLTYEHDRHIPVIVPRHIERKELRRVLHEHDRKGDLAGNVLPLIRGEQAVPVREQEIA